MPNVNGIDFSNLYRRWHCCAVHEVVLPAAGQLHVECVPYCYSLCSACACCVLVFTVACICQNVLYDFTKLALRLAKVCVRVGISIKCTAAQRALRHCSAACVRF